jgi:hypothetical protein
MNNTIPVIEVINMALNDIDIPDVSMYEDRMYQWAFWAELTIGTRGLSLPRKECVLDVVNFRARLPKDFFQIEAVKHGSCLAWYTDRSFRLFNDLSPHLAQVGQCDTKFFPISFNINSNFINCTLKDGQIGIAYYAAPFDSEGRACVIRKHADAVSCYIKYKFLSGRYFGAKIPEHIYKNSKQEWIEAMNRARVDDDAPTTPVMDKVAAMMNNQTYWPRF